VVIIDNMRMHKAPGDRQAIEASTKRFHFPPYTQDFNPIELASRKRKATLSTSAFRSASRLRTIIC
jgi:transposase